MTPLTPAQHRALAAPKVYQQTLFTNIHCYFFSLPHTRSTIAILFSRPHTRSTIAILKYCTTKVSFLSLTFSSSSHRVCYRYYCNTDKLVHSAHMVDQAKPIHQNRPMSVYRFPRRALTLCPQLCMGIQPGVRFPARSADALSVTLYGHFTQTMYRKQPIQAGILIGLSGFNPQGHVH
jgi:hypothetical protein